MLKVGVVFCSNFRREIFSIKNSPGQSP
jgi:hypothetical protein